MMKLKEFNNLYNLKEATILSIHNENNSLYIKASFEFYQEFMANGCRSDFEYEETYLFEFVGEKTIIKENKLYNVSNLIYKNNNLFITINNKDYIIKSETVNVEKLK